MDLRSMYMISLGSSFLDLFPFLVNYQIPTETYSDTQNPEGDGSGDERGDVLVLSFFRVFDRYVVPISRSAAD